MLNPAHSSPKNHGFTLIELLVVITIIGILAIVLIPNMVGMRQRARDNSGKQQLAHLKDALRLYYNDYQAYPTTGLNNAMNGCGDGDDACVNGGDFSANGTLYYKQLPDEFWYEQTLSGDGFVAWIDLENASDRDAAESATRCGKTPVAGDTYYYVCSY